MTVFLNTIILLGAIQGLIVSILLFRRKTNKQPDRLLGWLILLMSMASFNLYFLNTGIVESNKVLHIISYFVPLVIVMPMGPLIYFYIRSLSDPSFRLKRIHRVQFYAAIIDIVPELTTVIFIAGVYMKIFIPNAEPWGIFIDEYNKYADIPRWLSMTIYVWLSYRYIKKQRALSTGTEAIMRIKWLQQFITIFLVFQFIWFVYLVPYIIPAYSGRLLDLVDWYPIYIPLAIMIYWLGIKGYLFALPAGQTSKKKTATAELPGQVVEGTKELLKKIMQDDKLYLNPSFNLDLAATHTGIAPKIISSVLNQHLGLNFNDWVNTYRLEEFKQRIREADLARLTISAVAFECGFNSQATFQRIFKQSIGMTPSEYLKTVKC